MNFSVERRRENLAAFESGQVFDLVVVGGGITGAGVARDAASRGMSVALIEAQDFSEGTSSRSSKLIHGGIRYLENLEFGLVFEALRERSLLFEMAPHLVHPLRFVLPLYAGGRVSMFKMGLGMWLYDALALFETPEMHERWDRDRTINEMSFLKQDGLLGSYAYSDAYMDDDRLVIETLRSAENFGARSVNFVSAVGVENQAGQVVAVKARDTLTGREFRVQGRHFVSAVGPWTDIWGQAMFSNWRSLLRPSKGIHLTLSRNRLPLDRAVVMTADGDKRIVFAIPRHEMIIVGTTDTDYAGDPGRVVTEKSDVVYLLSVLRRYFPGAGIEESDVIASYAGIRPLVDDGSETESKTSREHLIRRDPRNVTFVTGGKYTTYRHMAEQTVETTLEVFSDEDRLRFSRGRTKEPLNSKATKETFLTALLKSEEWQSQYGLQAEEVAFMVERHGLEAERVFQYRDQIPSSRWRTRGRIWLLEALHSIDNTMCHNLKDFYLRRTHLFLSEPDHGLSLLPALGEIFASRLGWSENQLDTQVQLLREHLRGELAWKGSLNPF